MKHKVFVIIPAYNETEVIAATIKPLLKEGYQVVVVNDGSPTNIFDFIKDLPVHYLVHSINLGQGAALQTGHEFAKKFKPDFVVHFDADGQHNFSDIARFIKILEAEDVDIVLGSRFLNDDTKKLVPKKRQMLLKTARFLNWLFTGLLLTDAHNGFRVFRGQIIDRLRLTENRMAHATEILRLIKKNKVRYKEASTYIQYTDYSIAKGQRASASLNILIDIFYHRFIKI
ncbi:MAG: glycosyltransferase family 2 protein [Bacteroidota bacterium]|nr:glycosyltransferase family 2 protein [Bacteroidota bacterium]